MIVDGQAIAAEIKGKLKNQIEQMDKKPSLAVFVSVEDLATKKFIEIKKKFAGDVGIELKEKVISDFTTEQIVEEIRNAAKSNDGIVVQFPLGENIDTNAVRNAIPITHDVDVLSDNAIELFKKGELLILPPVVGAIEEIINRYNIVVEGRDVIVVGEGRLVGRPSAIWFRGQGAVVTTVTEQTSSILEVTKEADIVVLGAGSPGLLRPEMVKQGVVIFDAGTSASPVPGRPRESSGKLVGDADLACAEKASIFTPVPGGIGPITVAMIFKNLLELCFRK